ncbi:hypothetical protein [Thermoproteus uzoniensis]|uniref:hypothetical protein n=1 Tax=Thermoproteus uzoniensis TaxID=184117 RepID=UPI00069BFF8F|nr:hypothetical protein [Thermoproteus uzoniensis]
MCELYWELVERGIEVLGGPAGWAKAFDCSLDLECDCDVVVAESDIWKVPSSRCIWTIDEVGFSHRRVWIGGIPHISLDNLPKVKSPYTQAVLNCIRDALRRRADGGRPRQVV